MGLFYLDYAALGFLSLSQTIVTSAATTSGPTVPTITLDKGVFTGASVGSTKQYLGIPYAEPPYVLLLIHSFIRKE
jgi:hypothetical protein